MPDFYDAYADERLIINLFNGWGYNFYRAENQLRADDLMVRARVSEMLGAARAGIEAAEAVFRRAHLKPPTRAQPLPDPAALAQARALEAMSAGIGALEGQIRALPVPETDRMTQRLRDEKATLAALLLADKMMVGIAHDLQARLCATTAEQMLDQQDTIKRLLSEAAAALTSRRNLLQATAG